MGYVSHLFIHLSIHSSTHLRYRTAVYSVGGKVRRGEEACRGGGEREGDRERNSPSIKTSMVLLLFLRGRGLLVLHLFTSISFCPLYFLLSPLSLWLFRLLHFYLTGANGGEEGAREREKEGGGRRRRKEREVNKPAEEAAVGNSPVQVEGRSQAEDHRSLVVGDRRRAVGGIGLPLWGLWLCLFCC